MAVHCILNLWTLVVTNIIASTSKHIELQKKHAYISVAPQLGFNVNDAIVIDAVDDVNDVVGVDDVVVVDVHLHWRNVARGWRVRGWKPKKTRWRRRRGRGRGSFMKKKRLSQKRVFENENQTFSHAVRELCRNLFFSQFWFLIMKVEKRRLFMNQIE